MVRKASHCPVDILARGKKPVSILAMVVLAALANSGFPAVSFIGSMNRGDSSFNIDRGTMSGGQDGSYLSSSPFAADMVFRWVVTTPGDYLLIPTRDSSWTWYLRGQVGMQGGASPLYVPKGLTVRDLAISLENETGNLVFERLIPYNYVMQEPDDVVDFDIPITGAGTFTAITMTLGFDNPPLNTIGTLVDFHLQSSFGIPGSDGTIWESATVVPEPSAVSLLAVGMGVVALRRSRRTD